MNELPQLLSDCVAHGIRFVLTGDDELTIDAPGAALTSALMNRLKVHKPEILEILRSDTAAPVINTTEVWQAALDRLEGDPLFPPDMMEALRGADAQWAEEPDVEETDVVDPPHPCPKCGSLKLWQTMAGNWCCLRCDPPTRARKLAKLAARLKTNRTDSPRLIARGDR